MVLNAMAVLPTERFVMFNTLFGQGIASNLGGTMHNRQQNAAQARQYGLLGHQQQAQNAFPSQHYAQQAAMAQQQAQIGQQQMSAGAGQGISQPMRWMFDGVLVEFKDFVDLVFPEDTAEKTAFVLKYSTGD